MNIVNFENRKISGFYNSEWQYEDIVKDVNFINRGFSSKLTDTPVPTPTVSDVKLYYTESTRFIVDSIRKTIGLKTFKAAMIGVLEAESSFRSEGIVNFAYVGLDTAGLKGKHGMTYNVAPEILSNARLVAFAQRKSRYAVGFPVVVRERFKGERYELHALTSYIITNMARLSKGVEISDEKELVTLLLWSVNVWRSHTSQIKRYTALMTKYSGYNFKRASLEYIAAQRRRGANALTRSETNLLKKMNNNF